MDTLVLLRRGNKILIEGDTETKGGAETEGKTIQRLPHLGIHPIYSYKTHTLLSMPKKKEEQSMDTLVLLRRGNKISTEGDAETKGGAETEGKTIQRLPKLVIHAI